MINEDMRWAIYARDGYVCLCCGSKSRLTLDHIVPRSKGGADEESNLRTYCRSCNSNKNDRDRCICQEPRQVHVPSAPVQRPVFGEPEGDWPIHLREQAAILMYLMSCLDRAHIGYDPEELLDRWADGTLLDG